MAIVREYPNRHRAKSVLRALQRMGLALRTEVVVLRDGTIVVACNSADKAAAAIMDDGGTVRALPPLDARVVELYRADATVRFQAASGGGMVPADPARPFGPRANRRGA